VALVDVVDDNTKSSTSSSTDSDGEHRRVRPGDHLVMAAVQVTNGIARPPIHLPRHRESPKYFPPERVEMHSIRIYTHVTIASPTHPNAATIGHHPVSLRGRNAQASIHRTKTLQPT
jgi:hypothetical protein